MKRQDGDPILVAPVGGGSLLALLAGWETLDEEFPDVDEGLLPVREVEL